MERKKAISEPRQRILETADRLFYQNGIRAVGIDRIIAEAEVAKMSLYKHFSSKDDLILSVLKYREQSFVEFLKSSIQRHQQQKKHKLGAFFAALRDLVESDGFRGCPFQNAAAELADPNHEGTKFVREQKQRFSKMMQEIVVESVGENAVAIVPMIVLLVEGAVISAVIHGDSDSVKVAEEAAVRLLNGGAAR